MLPLGKFMVFIIRVVYFLKLFGMYNIAFLIIYKHEKSVFAYFLHFWSE